MKTKTVSQKVEYIFINPKYDEGEKVFTFKNLKPDADYASVVNVGKAIAKLHKGNSFKNATLIQTNEIIAE